MQALQSAPMPASDSGGKQSDDAGKGAATVQQMFVVLDSIAPDLLPAMQPIVDSMALERMPNQDTSLDSPERSCNG